TAKLVLHQRRFHTGADKGAISVQHRVAQVVVGDAVKLVRAAADGRIDDGAAGPSVFGAVVVGLHLEFLDGIGRRNDGLIRIALVRALVGVVVDAVKLKVVDHGVQAVDVVGSVAAGQREHFEQRLAHARNQRRKVSVGAAVQGQVDGLLGAYGFAAIAGVGLEQARRSGYLDGLRVGANPEREVNP